MQFPIRFFSIMAAAGLGLLGTSAFARDTELYDSGSRPYVVYKADLGEKGLKNKRGPIVADFDTAKQADEAAAKLNEKLKDNDPYVYMSGKREQDDAPPRFVEEIPHQGPSRPIIAAPPKLPRVDPGPYLGSKPKYPVDDPRSTEGAYNNPLKKTNEGNKLAGTVWDARRLSSYGGELRFGKDGKSVTLVMYGNEVHPGFTSEGTYELNGDTVTMNIKKPFGSWYRYKGVIHGSKISGTVTTDGFDHTYEWEVNRP